MQTKKYLYKYLCYVFTEDTVMKKSILILLISTSILTLPITTAISQSETLSDAYSTLQPAQQHQPLFDRISTTVTQFMKDIAESTLLQRFQQGINDAYEQSVFSDLFDSIHHMLQSQQYQRYQQQFIDLEISKDSMIPVE